MLYSPAKVAISGVLVWLLVWLATPVRATSEVALSALLFIVLCYGAFFAGCVLSDRWAFTRGRHDDVQGVWRAPFRPRLFWTVSAVGAVGMMLRVVDRVVFRGVDYSSNGLEVRDALVNASATPIAAVASLLFPFCFVPLIVFLAGRGIRSRLWMLPIALLLFMLPTLESLLQLSRSIMLATVALGFGALVCARFGGNPFNRELMLWTIGGLAVIALTSTTIFNRRLNLGERELADSVVSSVYADNLQPNDRAMGGLVAGGPLEQQFYATVLPNGMYYLSGLWEFSSLWTRPDEQVHSYGVYLLYPYAKFVTKIFAPDALSDFDEDRLVYKSGVFQTFFGPLWVDFGWFGLLFMLVLGAAMTALAQQARRGALNVFPLYLYMISVVFFFPVVNFMISGYGMFTINCFAAFALLAQRGLVDSPQASGGVPGQPLGYRRG